MTLDKEQKTKIDYLYFWDISQPMEIAEAKISLRAMVLETPGKIEFDDSRRAFIDFENVELPLVVRNRREGDVYRPLGSPGKRKLNEVFRQKGITPRERDLLPIILSKNEIVWSPGIPVSENFKFGKNTRKILMIEVERMENRNPN